MKRRHKQKSFTLENILVEDIAAEGKCIARHEDKIIFVEGAAAPGDVIDILITRQKSNYMEGYPVHFHSYSPIRTKAFCEHFGTCGGCKWQHIPYEKQTAFKHQQVVDALERIAKVKLPEVQPILPSSKTQYYRNKLEFTFSDHRWLTNNEINNGLEFDRRALGFHMPGKFDKILDIEHCYLQDASSNEIRLAVKNYALEHDLSFFSPRKMTGLLRNLIIRNSSIGELMVVVQFGGIDEEKSLGLMNYLAAKFPQITSLNYVINQKGNDTFYDLDVITFKGNDHIIEEMENLKFRVGPKSFFQTNSAQAYELYKITRDYAGLTGQENVYDLYTGTGTIALFVAEKAKKIVGLEFVEMAVEDAKINAKLNNINNASFFAGDMRKILNENFVSENGKPDVIITDPPRAGMDIEVIDVILKASPEKIVYVSCNPATQARDLSLLDSQYLVQGVKPVDMFPHTHHVENVVLLLKK